MQKDPILNAPIRSLQRMLREIGMIDTDIPLIIPDGIYGDQTKDAVKAFQRKHKLPITGIADEETFYLIASVYDSVAPELRRAQVPFRQFPLGLVVKAGETSPYVSEIQQQFHYLAGNYQEFKPVQETGTLDPETQENLRLIQRVSELPETGFLDATTYAYVIRLYHAGKLEDCSKKTTMDTGFCWG